MIEFEESDFEQLQMSSMWCEEYLRSVIYRQTPMLFCQLCDKKVYGKVWFRFCSAKCFKTHSEEVLKVKERHPRLCQFCSTPLPANANSRKKTCSKRCSDAHYWHASNKAAKRREKRHKNRLQKEAS